ncbi:MAG: sel1 repeat family protein, partial [Lentisphaeria bacterium]|nr:sel1 repeat family protein [Lentisphaeria bacterium]
MKILQKILILSSVLFLFPCLIGGGINSEELHDYGDSRAYLHAARHIAVNAEKNNLPKDSPEFKMALKWYMDIVKSHDLQAAKDALCNIGFMYRIGEGVKADYNKAMEWYQKAADRGSARAHRELGVKYGIRLRTEQSSYRKISAADDRSGLNPPHVSFNTGNPFDEDAMVRHFAIAAFWGDQPAVKQLDRYLFQIKLPASPRALFFARGVNFLLDNEAKGKDEQQRMKAVKLIEDAAVYDPYANIILAHCFMDGKFMKKDFAKAASYLKRAVSMKNLYAKIVLSKSSMAKYISREERIAYLKDL